MVGLIAFLVHSWTSAGKAGEPQARNIGEALRYE